MPRKALVTLAVLTLALSGCSASPTPSNPPVASEQASAQPTEEHQSPGHTLPVASIFGGPRPSTASPAGSRTPTTGPGDTQPSGRFRR